MVFPSSVLESSVTQFSYRSFTNSTSNLVAAVVCLSRPSVTSNLELHEKFGKSPEKIAACLDVRLLFVRSSTPSASVGDSKFSFTKYES